MIAKMGQDVIDRWRKSHRKQDLQILEFDVDIGPLFQDFQEEVAAQPLKWFTYRSASSLLQPIKRWCARPVESKN